MVSEWHHLLERASFVEVDGVDVHHFDMGDGEPLMLVHGGGLTSSAEMNWGAVLERFSERLRVIAPDLPGFGFTDPRGPISYQPAERATFLIQMIEQLDIDSISLAGNSEGATIVAHIALRRPDLVENVIPINGGLTVREFGEPTPRTTVEEPTLEGVQEDAEEYRTHYFTETKHHPFWRELTGEKIERLYEIEQRNWEYNNKRDEALRETAHKYNTALAYDGKPIPRQPEAFEVPVLLPWSSVPYYSIGYFDDPERQGASENPMAPLDSAYEFFRQLDDAQMHIWHDSKHHVQTDKAPQFVDVVTSFIGT